MRFFFLFFSATIFLLLAGCKKESASPEPPPPPPNFTLTGFQLNGKPVTATLYNVPVTPSVQLRFDGKVDRSSVTSSAISLTGGSGGVSLTTSYSKGDSVLIIQPAAPLAAITRYTFSLGNTLKATTGVVLTSGTSFSFVTTLDSTRKFPPITDDELLTLVQKQTFRYFWDFGHPVSGLARERNTSGDIVTSGGSGFGIMAIVTAIHRGFITRAEGLNRMKTIVGFLKNKAQTFHGAYPHWLNGATGDVVPFSSLDNGADLVETSYLMQGLLTARQFFNDAGTDETSLRADINTIWKGVDWNWFRKGGEDVLYWHWSPSNNWAMNMPVRGWNEALITYVLAASSPTFGVPKTVYDNGWALNGGIRNGKSFYGITLPLGPDFGGPLFFAHYSFLGINPTDLSDTYATSYFLQNKAHSQINHQYAIENPKGFYGYGDSTWGLAASDIPNGYTASSPTNDVGVISPTAALSSFPYTPTESMKALKFFYYVLGDKIWKEYGFVDAFSLNVPWFADSFLAIDQGPIIIMIENYRSGLLWDLFMSSPEVKTGLRNLGFSSPHI
ncbi:glucoamylase family protein [Flavisolibacter nicotianae]|uniref:glucoamylase family protein n=1 Tax=Flavisolibacter nicotianae TaxID=2364882 RepID=UPI000EB0E9D6|nr:glucoamylase family protein [Flavisolibacter nicotianae]